MTKTRAFTPAEQVAMLKRHLLEKVPASDLCDEYNIHVNQFYSWLKTFFENGAAAFTNAQKAKDNEAAKDKKKRSRNSRVNSLARTK